MEEECTNRTITVAGGLRFTVSCFSDVAFMDVDDRIGTGDNITDCAAQCAAYHPACYGAATSPRDGNCWFKNRDAVTAELTSSELIHYAAADFSQYTPYSSACRDRSTITPSADGAREFTVYCSKNYLGDDLILGLDGSSAAGVHAESLEECVELCAASEDGQCYGVAWNPDMLRGFYNCYPKAAADESKLENLVPDMHVALVKNNVDQSDETATSGGSAVETGSTGNGDAEETAAAVDSGGGGSKAWIAGPVLGSLAFLALFGALMFYLGRRKGNKQSQVSQGPHELGVGSPYSPTVKHELYNGDPRYEVPGGQVKTELHAHERPQELQGTG